MRKVLAITLVILIFFISPEKAEAQDIGSVYIAMNFKDAALEEVLQKIERLTGLKFNYQTADISAVNGITFQGLRVNVKKMLLEVLDNAGLEFEQVRQYIIIKKKKPRATSWYKLHGFVKARQSGENIIGATVMLSGPSSYTTITNAYGFYSFNIPDGNYQLNSSHTNFADTNIMISVQQTVKLDIEMDARSNKLLDPVIISYATKDPVRRNQMGFSRLSAADIRKNAMGGGEPDVLKSLQYLPGIQTTQEGTTNLSVRGGSYDQNLYLLDEAPVYNPAHALGFISSFNVDAIKDVSVHKGNFPAQYGGRLSSVVDIRMKEGNNKQLEFAGGLGLLAGRLSLEGPLKKDKSSFIVSGRYGNPGVFINLAHQLNSIRVISNRNKVSFYDFNLKLNSTLGKKDRLYLSIFTGSDQFYFAPVDLVNQMNWSNTTFALRWNHTFNTALFINTSVLYSRYNYANGQRTDTRRQMWKAALEELTVKTDADWSINGRNHLKAGIGLGFQRVSPGQIEPQQGHSIAERFSLDRKKSATLFAYLNNEQRVNAKLSVSYGVRMTVFAPLGATTIHHYNEERTVVLDSTSYSRGQIVHLYTHMEPRITARYLLPANTSIKLSYGRNYQYQHLLTSSSVGLPTDLWLPSGPNMDPQLADQLSAGIYKTFANGQFELSTELYFRKIKNVLDFKDNAELFLNKNIEAELLNGKAKAYGMEWMIKKNKGKFNGWISYTLSKALRKVDGINENDWYSPVYDHRHNASLLLFYQPVKRLQIALTMVFRTGGRTTLPVGSYYFNNARFLIYGKRNDYTLPSYHRLDLSATWQSKMKPKKRWNGEWVLNIYNVYDRKNAFALYVSPHKYHLADIRASIVYIIGILPSITYNFKF